MEISCMRNVYFLCIVCFFNLLNRIWTCTGVQAHAWDRIYNACDASVGHRLVISHRWTVYPTFCTIPNIEANGSEKIVLSSWWMCEAIYKICYSRGTTISIVKAKVVSTTNFQHYPCHISMCGHRSVTWLILDRQ